METEREKNGPPPPESGPTEAAQLKDQLLRLQADFENARKRWRKEQAQVQERANADLLRELLDISDDFQRALSAKVSDPNQLIAGVEMISRRLEEFLKSYGIAPIEAAGKPFDPLLHEAVAHEVDESVPEATVLEELRKGYQMNGKVLRTAVVKVASRPPVGSDPSEQNEEKPKGV